MSVHDLYEKRKSFFMTPPAALRGAILASLLVGVAVLGYGFFTGEGKRVWGAFLFNLFFFFAIALGGMALSAIQDVIGAKWARSIRRVQEGFGAFVPVGGLLILLFIAAVSFDLGDAGKVYTWIADPSVLNAFPGKINYLQPNWLYIRVTVIVLAIVALTFWQLGQSLKRDQALVDGDQERAAALGQESKVKLRFWSAPVLIVYGVGFSFLCFDLTMSLMPQWFSTLWGGWQFAIMMQTLMASMLIVMFAFKSSAIAPFLKRHHFHDVGKLMHGFTVFFAYLTYAHILTYWYGNVPEETEYFLHRLHQPWLGFVIAVPILGFVIPLYSLVFKAAKWTAKVTIPLAVMILVAQWFSYLIVVMPQVVEAKDWTFPLIEVGMFFGMFGLFASSFVWFAKRYPMVPIADPLFVEALAEEDHH